MKVVFLDYDTVQWGDLDNSVWAKNHLTPELWSSQQPVDWTKCLEVEVIISNKVLITAERIAGLPKLKLIVAAATGTNHIDCAAAKARGIVVCNGVGYSTNSVVQHTFASLFALMRPVAAWSAQVYEGVWAKAPMFCMPTIGIDDLTDKVWGIVGFGEIGMAVARVAEAFGAQILVAQRPGAAAAPGRVHLQELLARADIVSLHCPLTPETQGLMSTEHLGLMKPSAYLLNLGRGGLIDEAALLSAVQADKLRGVAVDVLSTEPPPADHPLVKLHSNRILITPHLAWGSQMARQQLLTQIVENILAFQSGSAIRVVKA